MSQLKAFQQVEDETPPGIGEEVGKAISPALTAMSDAVSQIGQQNTNTQQMLLKAIADALAAVDSKHITIENQAIRQWVFKIERDKQGLMAQITATGNP